MIDQSGTLQKSSRTRRPPDRFNYVAPGQAVYNLHAHPSDRPIIANSHFPPFVPMLSYCWPIVSNSASYWAPLVLRQ